MGKCLPDDYGIVCTAATCRHRETLVIDTRQHRGMTVRRRRECDCCLHRFYTIESALDPCLVISGGDVGMRCVKCGHRGTIVPESDPGNNFSVKRKRECKACRHRFTTYERAERIESLDMDNSDRFSLPLVDETANH